MRSRLAKSSPGPSFSTRPNSFQTLVYLSLSFSAMSSSRPSTRFTLPALMVSTTFDSCRISRDTLSGRSLESITPRMKRRYPGIRCSASSMMKTRRT